MFHVLDQASKVSMSCCKATQSPIDEMQRYRMQSSAKRRISVVMLQVISLMYNKKVRVPKQFLGVHRIQPVPNLIYFHLKQHAEYGL